MYEILQQIIGFAQQYEHETTPETRSYRHYVQWLAARSAAECAPGRENTLDTQLSILIGFLFKFAKYHSKPVLEQHGIRSIDEFVFLATLMRFPSQTKAELMARNVTDTPAGSDIIKRLVRKKYVIESVSPHDKRAKILNLTEQGRIAFLTMARDMQGVATIVAGNLSDEEKEQLLFLLTKLDRHHREQYFYRIMPEDNS